jgi:hypothetical protein
MLKRLGPMALISTALILTSSLFAQRGRGPTPRTPKESTLYDLTGYWVAVVTEDWRYRMVTPKKGDSGGVTLNQAGRKIAEAWDPAKDEQSGEQCRSYGAASIMNVPTRLHITWQDDETLKIEADNGQQTRLFHFASSQSDTGAGDWQGYSNAMWEIVPAGRGEKPIGSLKTLTTKMRPGYLRKNGVPYSASATLTEYLDRVNEPDGNAYLVVTSTVEDPVYLIQPFQSASHFRKEPDGSKWKPRPCVAKW